MRSTPPPIGRISSQSSCSAKMLPMGQSDRQGVSAHHLPNNETPRSQQGGSEPMSPVLDSPSFRVVLMPFLVYPDTVIIGKTSVHGYEPPGSPHKSVQRPQFFGHCQIRLMYIARALVLLFSKYILINARAGSAGGRAATLVTGHCRVSFLTLGFCK